MPLSTSVNPTDIATALGRPHPGSGSGTEAQWFMWISDALMLIQVRADALEVDTIDEARLDYVIREAVVAQVRRPDDAVQVTHSVDDGSVSKTYRTTSGRLRILDEWWTMLGLGRVHGRAFEVDTMPESAGVLGVDYWWTTTTETSPL